ncbi:MAG: hypothetical protein J6Z80_01835 [Clostridia bacterium]|nr:hypothetical protein [Clostridia bacterium]
MESQGASVSVCGKYLLDLAVKRLRGSTAVVSNGIVFADITGHDEREARGMNIVSLHTSDGIFFSAVQSRHPAPVSAVSEGAVVFPSEDNVYSAYIGSVPCSPSAAEPSISQLTAPGVSLICGKDIELKIDSADLPIGTEIRVYGLHEERGLEAGSSFTVNVKEKGILPLCLAAFSDGVLIGFTVYRVFCSAVEFRSADERLNGCFADGMRSILGRKISSVIPEEEPRGELLYMFSFWPRNFSGHTLSYFGFEDEACEFMRLLDAILIKDGFIKQNYSLSLFSDGSWGPPGNDGIGFYLWQWGKLMRRFPDKRPDPQAVRRALDFIGYNTRWNGLINDGTEPGDLFSSNKPAGSVYTQATVMAGLSELSGSYAETEVTEEEAGLVSRMRSLLERYISALKFDHRKTPWFDEYMVGYEAVASGDVGMIEPAMREWYTWFWSICDGNYYHGYSTAAPGVFFMSPESRIEGFDEKIANTVEKIIKENSCDVCSAFLYTHVPRVDAYVQLGVAINLLFLGETDRAYAYLNEYLKYSRITKLGYILPECIYPYEHKTGGGRTRMCDTLSTKKEKFPFLYGDPPDGAENLFGGFATPGNLIHLGYLFDMIDVMLGIYTADGGFVLMPRIPDALLPLSVTGIRTRWGEISVSAESRSAVYSMNGKRFNVRIGQTLTVKKEEFIQDPCEK